MAILAPHRFVDDTFSDCRHPDVLALTDAAPSLILLTSSVLASSVRSYLPTRPASRRPF
jgi:hypothetical protein